MRRNNPTTTRPVVSQPAAWLPVSARRWYRDGRLRVLKALAEQTADLRWSPALLKALLEELHTDDAFHELVRDPRNGSRQRYPQMLFLALAARHSWRPDDLLRLMRRLDVPATSRHTSPTPSDATTEGVRRPTRPHPEHHVFKSRARLRSVKALRSASTPRSGASGLDGAVGLARRGPLRDASGFHSPMARRTRDGKEKNHA